VDTRSGEILHDPATDRPLLGVRAHNRLVRFRGYRVARRAGIVGYRATYGLPGTAQRAYTTGSELSEDARQQLRVTGSQLREDGRQWEPVGQTLKAAGAATAQTTRRAARDTAATGVFLSGPPRRTAPSPDGTAPTPVTRPAEGTSYTRQRVMDALLEAQRSDWEHRARPARGGDGDGGTAASGPQGGGSPLKPKPRPVPQPDSQGPADEAWDGTWDRWTDVRDGGGA
jgi:hypothetical protein